MLSLLQPNGKVSSCCPHTLEVESGKMMCAPLLTRARPSAKHCKLLMNVRPNVIEGGGLRFTIVGFTDAEPGTIDFIIIIITIIIIVTFRDWIVRIIGIRDATIRALAIIEP